MKFIHYDSKFLYSSCFIHFPCNVFQQVFCLSLHLYIDLASSFSLFSEFTANVRVSSSVQRIKSNAARWDEEKGTTFLTNGYNHTTSFHHIWVNIGLDWEPLTMKLIPGLQNPIDIAFWSSKSTTNSNREIKSHTKTW